MTSKIHKPTPEQAAAADPTVSVWCTANAGTGKTRVLSDRVLRLLLKGAPPESVLCITFTKAAAVEMNERIERDLAAWAVETEDERLADRLEATTGVRPDAKGLVRARRLFAQTLELPRGLGIMTIHSYCQTILQRFPIEAGVPAHFGVIDPRAAAELRADAKAAVLGRAGDDKRIAAALTVLAGEMAESSIGRLLDEALDHREAMTAPLRHHGSLDALLKAKAKALGHEPGTDPRALESAFCDLAAAGVDEVALKSAAHLLLDDGGKTNTACGQAILDWLALTPAERAAALPAYRKAFLTADGEPLKTTPTKKWRESFPDRWQRLEDEGLRLLELQNSVRAWRAYSRGEAALILGQAVAEEYEAAKKREAALDFDDLIERTAELLSDPQRRDWVLFKLDARLQHLLIDEAQDTSPAQWKIVESLIEEFLAGEGAHEHPRTFFVVGDEKQSIYSFQGANLENFRLVRDRLAERARQGGHPFAERRLATSFRTSQAVLSAVDACLKLPESCPAVVDEGAEVLHESFRRNDSGSVELWPLARPPAVGEERGEPWALPGKTPIRPSAEELAAAAVAHAVRSWLDDPTPLPSTKRRARPGDVLILLSRRGRAQELVIRKLKQLGVPVAGADRLDLNNHIAVRDLVALGQATLLPEDDLNLACLLKSPLIGLDGLLAEEHGAATGRGMNRLERSAALERALFEICANRGPKKVVQRLRELADSHGGAYKAAWERFSGWLARADFAPPFEFYTRILANGGRERLLARLGPDAAEPIEAFLGQALAFESGHPSSLQGFLHWLGLEKQQLKRDPEPARSEVRVMTVHGSKGLEAPIVVLADAGPYGGSAAGQDKLVFASHPDCPGGLPCWRGSKAERPAVIADACDARDLAQTQERMRLLYVALTRAKDRLFVTGWHSKSSAAAEDRGRPDAASWHALIKQALEACGPCEEVPLGLPWLEGQALRLRKGASTLNAEPEAASGAALPRTVLPAWVSPVRAEPPGQLRLAPSRLNDDGHDEPPAPSPANQGAYAGRGFGTVVHRLLHLLAAVPLEEREATLAKALNVMAANLDERQRDEAARQVLTTLALPDLAPVFAPGSRGEQPIVGRLGDYTVTGQIDRLAVTDREVLLVDFKSSAQPPPSLQATPKAYARQLALYAALMACIHPNLRVRAGLVWTATPRFDELPQGLLVESLPAGVSALRAER